ncbi:MAG: hypothetical protein ACYC6R_02785 [Anaerolineales bacterium]
MAASSRHILSIWLIRGLAYRLSRIVRRKVSVNWAIVLLSLSPLIINLLVYPFGLSCKGITSAWLLYLVLLNYCLFEFPKNTWSRLIAISDLVDEMLETDENKRQYIAWMKWRLSLRTQVLLSILGGITGIVATTSAIPLLTGTSVFYVAFYMSLLITGALGINAVYWLWGVPLQIRRLSQFSSLRLTWNNPVGTPGIRAQSQLLGFSAVLSAIGVVLFVTPILWAYLSTHSIPRGFVNSIAFAASLGTVLFVAVSPQYWLSAIVYREKNKILDQLGKEIHSDRDNNIRLGTSNWQQLESEINVYQVIKATSISTVDISTFGKYALAIVTTALPYLVQWPF